MLYLAECGQPNADDSTTVQVASTSHGSEATYTCASGFDTIEGETVRLCGSDGQWSGKAPVCKLIGNHTYKSVISIKACLDLNISITISLKSIGVWDVYWFHLFLLYVYNCKLILLCAQCKG